MWMDGWMDGYLCTCLSRKNAGIDALAVEAEDSEMI